MGARDYGRRMRKGNPGPLNSNLMREGREKTE